jgi:predicted nucleic acid-binding protein
MIVVSDSSPLIGLAQIQRLELLQCLFGEIFIPQAVYDEVVIAGRKKGRDVQAVSTATWIKTVVVSDPSSVGALLKELDEGEVETIVLAQALNAEWVLMDEKVGRRKLTQMGINKHWHFGHPALGETRRIPECDSPRDRAITSAALQR